MVRSLSQEDQLEDLVVRISIMPAIKKAPLQIDGCEALLMLMLMLSQYNNVNYFMRG